MTGARDPAIDALLAAARLEFAAKLPAKAAELEALVGRGAWDEARRAAHRLRGSAATYGYPALGAHAAAIEDTILEAGGHPDGESCARIDRALVDARVEAERAAGGAT